MDRKTYDSVLTQLQKWRGFKFIYLSGWELHVLRESQECVVAMRERERLVDVWAGLGKAERRLVMFRVARAVGYLEGKGVKHDKVEAENIFIDGGLPVLGLPYCNTRAKACSFFTATASPYLHQESLARLFL